MKKSSKKMPFSRRLALLVPAALLAGVAAVNASQLHRAEVVGPLSYGANRHVANVTCSGMCDDILLVSDQEPDVKYYTGTTSDTCSEAILWANKGREGQIMFAGYQFVNGYQVNLPTKTFDLEVLVEGITIPFTLPNSEGVLDAQVINTGEWNLLDVVGCDMGACPVSTRVFTDRDAGRVKLYDSCSASSDAINVYALYQSPEVHGPGDDDTYRVDIEKRESFGTGWDGGEPKVFEYSYTSSELAADSIHVVADVGDTTFEFDLVRDAE